ncbi:phosphosulfolactate synthase XecG [Methyloglobulus morosus KoM1]|uniref:Phosphosulfolactate synthase XecG n=1 Tax=Methyloglobulus morosus KoM1 TaxID=1116472 RepID=V5DY63_9GAMM|nr:phosphosulfolactate synthase [Methyloglobulus morosus]ESS72261.1 phosphosulfolactate synthase XecG [Methyloglobulus morosus KoM1]
MAELAWENIIGGQRDSRERKPRKTGCTMVMDVGKSLHETQSMLQLCSNYIDHWKFGFGTSVFMDKGLLQEKLQILAAHNILTFPGGTLLEVALLTHHCRVYMTHAKSLGFTAVEISDGILPIPRFRRKRIIECALNAGLIPITEVGKKDPKRQPTPEQIAEEIKEDLEWGAAWVIIEGRESGHSVGVFDESGNVDEYEVDVIVGMIGDKSKSLIWETPLKSQQAFFIEKFGANAGLGNIPLDQVLAVEALRNGLRFDTLNRVTSKLLREGSWDPNQVESNGAVGTPLTPNGTAT